MDTLEFGKYPGRPISEVPDKYLRFLVSSSQRTIDMCKAEIERREHAEDADASWIDRLIKVGYRELLKRHHPDVGGNTADTQQINAAFATLKTLLHRR